MALSIQHNVSLKPYNTFRIDVVAKYFAEIFSESDLSELFALDITRTQPVLVLGGGSNMLFTKDFDGLVVKISIDGILADHTKGGIAVTAGAGVVWNDLVKFCVNRGFGGLENLSLIPGTVGASPVQNIGAYGIELKDVFLSCRAFKMRTGEIDVFDLQSCRFSYRESIFKQELKGQYIITSVTFLLSEQPQLNLSYGAISDELRQRGIAFPGIKDVSDVVSSIRVAKLPDPSTIGNAGSFFKNPVIDETFFTSIHDQFPSIVNYPAGSGKIKLAAGWLIEQCGFKGVVSGHTGTWKNQALVLVNHGGATGAEVYDFSEHIISEVFKKFGVLLEREVNIF